MFWKNKPKMEIIDVSYLSKIDQQNIKRVFTRVFSSDDGKKALAYLQYITFHRNLGAGASNDQLRHIDGQRSLVATILNFVEQGKSN